MQLFHHCKTSMLFQLVNRPSFHPLLLFLCKQEMDTFQQATLPHAKNCALQQDGVELVEQSLPQNDNTDTLHQFLFPKWFRWSDLSTKRYQNHLLISRWDIFALTKVNGSNLISNWFPCLGPQVHWLEWNRGLQVILGWIQHSFYV